MTTQEISSKVKNILLKQKVDILEEKQKHIHWPPAYFKGKISGIQHWIKQSEVLTIDQLINGITQRKNQLEKFQVRIQHGRLDLNRLYAEKMMLKES